jgi:hypothetical protein
MKNWRERALEAEKRGHWLDEDQKLWRDRSTCPAAEVATRYGVVHPPIGVMQGPWSELWNIGDMMGVWPSRGTRFIDLMPPRLFVHYLDHLEDLALELKRAAMIRADLEI